MCLMMTPSEPSDTLLVLAPLDGGANCGLATNGPPRWQLTYINTVGGTEVLMVVPIPNKHGSKEEDFVLSAVHSDDVSSVRSTSKEAFRPYGPEPKDTLFGGLFGAAAGSPFGAMGGAPPLAVQEVGAYKYRWPRICTTWRRARRGIASRALWDGWTSS